MNDRKKYLGGSDAAAVLGLSRFKTPLAVWGEKTGNLIPEDISEKLQVKLGNKLEATVCELFSEETGKKVRRVNETIFHPKYPFIGANIDRRVVGEDSILEVKTTSSWKYREWSDQEIPQEYLIQVLHYLAVTGAKKGYIACLIGNTKFVWKEVTRDEKLINDLIKKEVRFWNDFVVTKTMPATITANDSDVLYRLFPQAQTGEEVTLGDKANAIIESIDSLEVDKKSVEKQIEQQKNELKAMLGNKESGNTGKYRVAWKNVKQTRLDLERIKLEDPNIYALFGKTIEYRTLSITEYDKKGE
jgi:putative phage-type endonuclease